MMAILWNSEPHGLLNELRIQYNLTDRIREAQKECKDMQRIHGLMERGYNPEFREDEQGALWCNDRICVPSNPALREEILSEAHDSKYYIHPSCVKMYRDIRKHFWWKSMKADIAGHVARCDICNRVKAEHKRPAGLLKPLDVPEWKWEDISMDFIVGLPRSMHGNNAILVVVDRLTKVAHFLPVKETIRAEQLADTN